jgi:hypothetical protein
MAKWRVSSLARELGRTSKEVITWLNDHGEYVKTPSSTLESPVAAKVMAAFEGVDDVAPIGEGPFADGPTLAYSTDEGLAEAPGSEWLVKVRFRDREEGYCHAPTHDHPSDFTPYMGSAIRFSSRAAALHRSYQVQDQRRNVVHVEVVMRPRSFVQQYGGSGRA